MLDPKDGTGEGYPLTMREGRKMAVVKKRRRPAGSERRPKLTGPGVLGSIKEAKKSVERGKQNRSIRQIPDTGIVVRFLDEPHEMAGYYEHWDKNGPFPCIEGGDCRGCNSDDDDVRRRSFRYLGNAYVVDDQEVKAIKLPKTVYEQLLAYYEDKGTLLDRDYELKKKGSGRDGTTYLVAPDSPSRINLSRFMKKKHDLEELLYSMLGEDAKSEEEEDEEEEDDYEETRRRPKSTKRRRVVEDDDEDDYDDEDEEDEEDDEDEEEDDYEPAPRRRVKKKTSAAPAKRIVKKSSTTRKPVRKITRNR